MQLPTNLGFWEGVAEWATTSLETDALLYVRAKVVAFVSYDRGGSRRKYQADYEPYRSLHGQRDSVCVRSEERYSSRRYSTENEEHDITMIHDCDLKSETDKTGFQCLGKDVFAQPES